MIENKIDELFQTINNSKEYQAYLNIGEILEKDEEINRMVSEIKKLQQKSVRLEEKGDNTYKEIDKVIDEKVKLLNEKPIYQEYLRRMNELNDILAMSSSNIEKYINSKI
ncbi:MAG: YlbF family regulator [Erysipelotrichaceae bacterium]|nr:YlbF family regulator [Erysipelotrichaceae bacterium]